AYRGCTLANDGIEDTTVWNLPALGELMLMAKYKKEINELVTSMFGSQNILTTDWYWSSTEYDASSSWYVHFHNGGVYPGYRQNANRVRPLAAINALSL
uniref:Lcl domain-containing protein n=1 Tax=Bacteroides congonensis TaxID=1871006 RepID=UPI00189C8800